LRLGKVAQVDRFLGRQVPEVAVHALGEKRNYRSNQLGQCDQNDVQGLISRLFVRALLALPKSTAVAANVPVTELVIDELLHGEAECHHIKSLVLCFSISNQEL